MLREEFLTAASQYTSDQKSKDLWQEIDAIGHESGRHYHTLDHFEHLLRELMPHKQTFTNWHTHVFAVAYHDSIYNPVKINNEEKSAALAMQRLQEIGFPQVECERCVKIILATKKHEPADEETNLFTDADLSILGSEPAAYDKYTKQIRREYGMFPGFLYTRGRKKVLQHFLNMPRIFKTDYFHNRYEAFARINLADELALISRPTFGI